MLKEYGPGLWACRVPFKAGGVEISTQMVVVRLPDRALVLISPIELNLQLKEQLENLGVVKYIVSPNNFHHLYVNNVFKVYPAARFLCPPGLSARVDGLPICQDLHEMDPSIWQGQLHTVSICRSHVADEMAFFHQPSQTLILTDLFMNIEGDIPVSTKIFRRAMGLNKGLSMSRLYRLLSRDKAAMRESFRQIMAWDFERVLLAHNSNVSSLAKRKVRKAMNPILGEDQS